MKFIRVVFVVFLLSGLVWGYGTLSTESGDIYVYPAGGAVLPNVSDGFDLGSSGLRWRSLHVGGIETGTYGDLFPVDKGGVGGLMFRLNATYVGFTFSPDRGNASRNVFLYTRETSFDHKGLILQAASYGDMMFSPATDNNYDLGISGYAWKDVYLAGGIVDDDYSATALIGGRNPGWEIRPYNNASESVYLLKYATSFDPSRPGLILYSGSANERVFNPHADNAYYLGSPSNRWAKGYVRQITNITYIYPDASGVDGVAVYVIGPGSTSDATLGLAGDNNLSQRVILSNFRVTNPARGLVFQAVSGEQQFIPGADNTYDLGDASYAWKDIYYEGSLTDTSPDAIEKELNSKGMEALDFVVRRDGDTLDISDAPEAVYRLHKDNPSSSTDAGVVHLDVGEGVVWSHLQINELLSRVEALESQLGEKDQEIEALEDRIRELEPPTTGVVVSWQEETPGSSTQAL